MAYEQLKQDIAAYVKQNGEGAITGDGLQAILIEMVNSLGTGYEYMGVATPSTSAGTPSSNVFYLGSAGTYANFGTTFTVPNGSLAVIYYDTTWHNSIIRTDSDSFMNVNDYNGATTAYANATNARNAVPSALRKSGMQITYKLSDGWYIDQFIGSDISGWGTASNWKVLGPVSVSQNTSTLEKFATEIQIGNNKRTIKDKELGIYAKSQEDLNSIGAWTNRPTVNNAVLYAQYALNEKTFLLHINFTSMPFVTQIEVITSSSTIVSNKVDNIGIIDDFSQPVDYIFKAGENANYILFVISMTNGANITFDANIAECGSLAHTKTLIEPLLVDNNVLPFDSVSRGTINDSDGSVVNSTTRIVTPLFRVHKDTWFDFGKNEGRVFYYNSDGTKKERAFYGVRRCLVATNEIIRITIGKTDGTTLTDDDLVSIYNSIKITHFVGNVLSINAIQDNALKLNNSLLNCVQFKLGVLRSSDGTLNENNRNYLSSLLIKIPKGVTLNLNNSDGRIAFYDKDGTYINEFLETSLYIAEEDKFVRFSVYGGADIYADYIQWDKQDDLINKISTSYNDIPNKILSLGKRLQIFTSASIGVTSFSDFFVTDKQLYVAYPSNDDHSDTSKIKKYQIDVENGTQTLLGEITHNIGHCNTIDYCKETDCAIIGNALASSSGSAIVYIIPEATQKDYWLAPNTTIEGATPQNSTTAIAIDMTSDISSFKVQAVWGESNGGKCNIIYVLNQNQNNIYKVLLLETDGQFNGNYIILSHWIQKTKLSDNDVNQGSFFYNGKLFTGIGHSEIRLFEHILQTDGYVDLREYKDVMYNDDGTINYSGVTEGCETDGVHLFVGTGTGLIGVYYMF